jgi:serine/threonine-protein kinase
LTLAILAFLLYEFYPIWFLEHRAYDLMSRARSNSSPGSVVIVGIDAESIDREAGVFSPRDQVAELINQLSRNGAAAIGLSLVFGRSAHSTVLEQIKSIQTVLRKDKLLKKTRVAGEVDNMLSEAADRLTSDKRLIRAVRRARNIVLPFIFAETSSSSDASGDISRLLKINSIAATSALQARKPFSSDRHSNEPNQSPVYRIIETNPELSRMAGALGHLNVFADSDGIVRWIPLLLRHQDRYFPSMSLQLAAKYRGISLRSLSLENADGEMQQLYIKSTRIPTDSDYRMLIGYDANTDRIPTYSIRDVVQGNFAPEAFKDNIVLIGFRSEIWTRTYQTPVYGTAAPVEIMAAAVDTIISRNFVSRPRWALYVEIGVVLYFCLFLLFVIPSVSLRIGGIILTITLFTWLLISVLLFILGGIWVWMFSPILLTLAGFLLAAYHNTAQNLRAERLEMNRTLGLSFQSQGLLDMAYEKFIQCPVEEKSVKELLYNLGLDYERKRQSNKALNVYEKIISAGRFKDVQDRIGQLSGTAILEGAAASLSSTVRMDNNIIAPTFGRYEILKELGHGAMGTVYLGKDPKINRDVAIKTLKYSEVPEQELNDIKERFFREAETAGKLSHSNIVTIYDIGEEHDIAYIAMELLDGEDLSVYCRKDNLLTVIRVLGLLTSVAEALGYAHRNGVVHRDIKPANIILMAGDQVKVADFGIARIVDASKTRTGVVLGTPYYMSPEQVAGKNIDGRSDLFSLGVVFYELLTGEKPFDSENLASLTYAISECSYTPISKLAPQLPSCCVRIVDHLLRKELNERCESAEQLAENIRVCMAEMD